MDLLSQEDLPVIQEAENSNPTRTILNHNREVQISLRSIFIWITLAWSAVGVVNLAKYLADRSSITSCISSAEEQPKSAELYLHFMRREMRSQGLALIDQREYELQLAPFLKRDALFWWEEAKNTRRTKSVSLCLHMMDENLTAGHFSLGDIRGTKEERTNLCVSEAKKFLEIARKAQYPKSIEPMLEVRCLLDEEEYPLIGLSQKESEELRFGSATIIDIKDLHP